MKDIRACELCGSAVTVETSEEGTRFYIPVANEFLEQLLDSHVDQFIRDRLRRCERIVVDLRNQISEQGEKKNG